MFKASFKKKLLKKLVWKGNRTRSHDPEAKAIFSRPRRLHAFNEAITINKSAWNNITKSSEKI